MCRDGPAVPGGEGELGAVQGLVGQDEPLQVFRVEPVLGEAQEKALVEAIQFVSDDRESQGKQCGPYLMGPAGPGMGADKAQVPGR